MTEFICLKYLMSTTLGCKETRKSEFVAKTQFCFQNLKLKYTIERERERGIYPCSVRSHKLATLRSEGFVDFVVLIYFVFKYLPPIPLSLSILENLVFQATHLV